MKIKQLNIWKKATGTAISIYRGDKFHRYHFPTEKSLYRIENIINDWVDNGNGHVRFTIAQIFTVVHCYPHYK